MINTYQAVFSIMIIEMSQAPSIIASINIMFLNVSLVCNVKNNFSEYWYHIAILPHKCQL